jgi:hypothetical protein
MSRGITHRFFFEIFLQRFGKIYPGLVGDANEHEQNVRQFLFQLFIPVTFFEGLVAILPGDNARHLSYFFGEHGHIGEFGKVPYSVLFDPVINFRLGLFEGHIFLQIFLMVALSF